MASTRLARSATAAARLVSLLYPINALLLTYTGHISRNCTEAEVNGEGAPVPAAAAAPAPTTAVA